MSVERLPQAIRQYLGPEDASYTGATALSGNTGHASNSFIPGTVRRLFPQALNTPVQTDGSPLEERGSSGGGSRGSSKGSSGGGWDPNSPHKGEWKRTTGPWTEAVGRAERMNANEGDKSLGCAVAHLADSLDSCKVIEIDGREFAQRVEDDFKRSATALTDDEREWALLAVSNDFQHIAEQRGCPDLSEEHRKTLWKAVAYFKHPKDQMPEQTVDFGGMTEGDNPIHMFADLRIKKKYRKEAQQGGKRFARAASSMPDDCMTADSVAPITVELSRQQVDALNDQMTPAALDSFKATLDTVKASSCKWGKRDSYIYEADKLLKLQRQGAAGNHRSDMMSKYWSDKAADEMYSVQSGAGPSMSGYGTGAAAVSAALLTAAAHAAGFV